MLALGETLLIFRHFKSQFILRDATLRRSQSKEKLIGFLSSSDREIRKTVNQVCQSYRRPFKFDTVPMLQSVDNNKNNLASTCLE